MSAGSANYRNGIRNAIIGIRRILSKHFLYLAKEQKDGGHNWLKRIHVHKSQWANWCFALAELFESLAVAINGGDE